MKRSFIFDIDGTLVDSNDYHAKAWEEAFKQFGISVSNKSIRSHMGKGGDQLMPGFLSKEQMETISEKIAKERSAIFKKKYANQIRPFGGVRELFQAIRARDGRIALASSGKKEEVREAMMVAQITDLVEHSTSSDDAEKSKPEPDIFYSALAALENPPLNSVTVIGDTPYDALAAVKAHLKPIGVSCGGFSESELRGSGCLEVYRDPEHILSNLDAIFQSGS